MPKVIKDSGVPLDGKEVKVLRELQVQRVTRAGVATKDKEGYQGLVDKLEIKEMMVLRDR